MLEKIKEFLANLISPIKLFQLSEDLYRIVSPLCFYNDETVKIKLQGVHSYSVNIEDVWFNIWNMDYHYYNRDAYRVEYSSDNLRFTYTVSYSSVVDLDIRKGTAETILEAMESLLAKLQAYEGDANQKILEKDMHEKFIIEQKSLLESII